MKSLKDKIAKIEDQHAEDVFNEHIQTYEESAHNNALMILGGLRAVDRVSQMLSAQMMASLIRFKEEKMFESLGYTNFYEFLDNSEYAPITRNQFSDRFKLFKKEGERLFDLMNEIGMPLSKRKLLGKGNISFDGEMVLVKDDEGNETEIEINDRARILETITALADANADKSKKLETEKQKIKDVEKQNAELSAEKERILAYKKAEFTDFHTTALMNLAASFKSLEHQAEQLTSAEKAEFAPKTFETIAALMDDLSAAYGRTAKTDGENSTARQVRLHKEAVEAAQTREQKKLSAVTSTINDEELADLMD